MADATPPQDRTARRTGLVLGAVVLAGFVVAWQFVDPPPPERFRLGTGGPGGSYHAWGEALARALAEDGFEVQLVPSAGSLENLARLRAGELDLAFVQGGTTAPDDRERLTALGAVAYEPLWILARADRGPLHLAELRGARLHVGAPGSGTRAVVLALLSLAGLAPESVELVDLPPTELVPALRAGELDAAFLVTGPRAVLLAELLAEGADEVGLASLVQAEALARHLPYLEHLAVPAGLLDPARRRPREVVHVVAPTAALVARDDFHGGLPPLILERATELFGEAGLLADRGRFPAPAPVDLPLGRTARHYHEHGLGFLHRVLPFSVASSLQRLMILLLPLLTLLIPLVKVAPPLVRWRHRSRIYRWYADVRRIEGAARRATTRAELDAAAEELRAVEADIAQVVVPLSYHEELYNLRLHLDVVRRDVEAARERAPDIAPGSAQATTPPRDGDGA